MVPRSLRAPQAAAPSERFFAVGAALVAKRAETNHAEAAAPDVGRLATALRRAERLGLPRSRYGLQVHLNTPNLV